MIDPLDIGLGMRDKAFRAGDSGPKGSIEKRLSAKLEKLLQAPKAPREIIERLKIDGLERLKSFLDSQSAETPGLGRRTLSAFRSAICEAYREGYRATQSETRGEPEERSESFEDHVRTWENVKAKSSTAPPLPNLTGGDDETWRDSGNSIRRRTMLHLLSIPIRADYLIIGLAMALGIRFREIDGGEIERDEASEDPDWEERTFDAMRSYGLCCPVLHRDEDGCDWLHLVLGVVIRKEADDQKKLAAPLASFEIVKGGYGRVRLHDTSADWAHGPNVAVVDGEAFGVEATHVLARPSHVRLLNAKLAHKAKLHGMQGLLPFSEDRPGLAFDGERPVLGAQTLFLDHALSALADTETAAQAIVREIAQIVSTAKKPVFQEAVDAYNDLLQIQILYRHGGAYRMVRKFDGAALIAPDGDRWTGDEVVTLSVSRSYLEAMSDLRDNHDRAQLYCLMPVTRALLLPRRREGVEALQLLRLWCSLMVQSGAVNFKSRKIAFDQIKEIDIDTCGSVIGAFPDDVAALMSGNGRKGQGKSRAERGAIKRHRDRVNNAADLLVSLDLIRVERHGRMIRALPTKEHAEAWRMPPQRCLMKELLPSNRPGGGRGENAADEPGTAGR